MTKAHRLMEAALTQHDVVWVYEDGTHDPFQAIYVDDRLIVTSPRRESTDLLEALGITPRQMVVQRGFDGNFPESLKALAGQLSAPKQR